MSSQSGTEIYVVWSYILRSYILSMSRLRWPASPVSREHGRETETKEDRSLFRMSLNLTSR